MDYNEFLWWLGLEIRAWFTISDDVLCFSMVMHEYSWQPTTITRPIDNIPTALFLTPS